MNNDVESYNIKTTCAFSGHRILKKDFSIDVLEEKIDEAIKRGYRTFLVGMARGFDLLCFKILLKKREFNIDIIAYVPCKEQDKFYKVKEKEDYLFLLSKADKIIYVSDKYTPNCMFLRNKLMVDNSSLLISYLYVNKGGTFQTVNYAKTKQKEIIFVK